MNNSKIVLDNQEADEQQNTLQHQQGELSQIVEAINAVESSDEWKKLKKLVLDPIVPNLERRLIHETSKKEIDVAEIYRLQGQLMWAHKYADLKKFGEWKKQELENVKNQLKHEKNPRDGAL